MLIRELCSGLKRQRSARGEVTVTSSVVASLLALTVLGACSDAGGGADDAPFAGSGGSGNGTASTLNSNGSVLPPAGGSGGGQAEAHAPVASDPADFIDDEPEPEPEPEPSAFPESPSCAGARPDACQGDSCCKREPVITGEAMLVATNVTVSLASYALDKYEVSVGRFRAFMASYDEWRDAGNPKTGAGAHPFTPGSGWVKDPSWEVELPDSAAVMRVGLNCNANQQTWTDQPSFNENKPINCVNWYEALAFCAWDGGRLPTEAEWQYAAVGGAQARPFAWGNTPLTPNFAVYGCLAAGTGSTCSVDDIPDVGSRPDGYGRFNHSDLNGSVLEWTLDWLAPYPELMRDNYAKTDSGTERMLRGGCWNTTYTDQMLSSTRHHNEAPKYRSPATGIRCAREVVVSPR